MQKLDRVLAVVKNRADKARKDDDDYSFYSMSEGIVVSAVSKAVLGLENEVKLAATEPYPVKVTYAEPHRHYHTWRHIEECRTLLSTVEGLTTDERRLIDEALIWHDVVYDPAAKFGRNELKSALLAYEYADVRNEEERLEVVRLVLLTAGHSVPAEDRLGAIMVSIDLTILGADADEYDAYAEAVKQEYLTIYTEEQYTAGRIAFLQSMQKRKTIFPDPEFRNRYEYKALRNFARELQKLY